MNALLNLPSDAPLFSPAFPGADIERRSHLNNALFDAGAPYVASGPGALGCFTVFISMQPRSEWANGIAENARGAKFILHDDGSLKCLTRNGVEKFRARKVKSFEGLVDALVAWVKLNKAAQP